MNEPNLIQARNRIDHIDDQILDLLGKRAGIIQSIVRAKKHTGSALRPEREAAILRRLYTRTYAPHTLPFEGVARVWREILSNALLQQGDVTILVPASTKIRDLTRQHFGNATTLKSYNRDCDLYEAVSHDKSLIGIIASSGKFAALDTGTAHRPMIFSALPFWGSRHVCAYAYGYVPLSESGDDITLISLESHSKADIQTAICELSEAGIQATHDRTLKRHAVFALDGFHVTERKPAERLKRALRSRKYRLLGAYARPIGVKYL